MVQIADALDAAHTVSCRVSLTGWNHVDGTIERVSGESKQSVSIVIEQNGTEKILQGSHVVGNHLAAGCPKIFWVRLYISGHPFQLIFARNRPFRHTRL